jgi:DNA-directed RNA polymerase specialized sigma24 family protein
MSEGEMLEDWEGMVRVVTRSMRAFWRKAMGKEDALQEARLATLRAIRTHNPRKLKLATHISICIRNRIIQIADYRRRSMRTPRGERVPLRDAVLADYRARTPLYEDEAAALWAAVASLPPPQRRAVVAVASERNLIEAGKASGMGWRRTRDRSRQGCEELRAMLAA